MTFRPRPSVGMNENLEFCGFVEDGKFGVINLGGV